MSDILGHYNGRFEHLISLDTFDQVSTFFGTSTRQLKDIETLRQKCVQGI